MCAADTQGLGRPGAGRAARSSGSARRPADRSAAAGARHSPGGTRPRSAGTPLWMRSCGHEAAGPCLCRRPRRRPARPAPGTGRKQDHEHTAGEDHRPDPVTRTGHAEPTTSSVPEPKFRQPLSPGDIEIAAAECNGEVSVADGRRSGAPDCAGANLCVPRTWTRHATCTYSCTRPPSRSRRSGRTGTAEGGGVRHAGGR